MTRGADTDFDGLIDGLGRAGCVTAVAGPPDAALPAEEFLAGVVRAFGGDPDYVAELDGLDGLDGLGGPSGLDGPDEAFVLVSRAGSAVVVLERGGFEGSREEVLRPLSRLGARAASVCGGGDAPTRLSLAEDGQVLSAFETLTPQHRHGARPQAWDAYLAGLSFGAGEGWGGGVAAVARATGAELDAAWREGTHLVVRVEPVPRAVLPQALEDSPLLAEEPFAGYLASPDPRAVPDMERYAVELAAGHNGLTGESLCTLALAVLDGCGPPEGRARLRVDLADARAAARGERERLLRAAAGAGAAVGGAGCRPGHDHPAELAARRAVVWQVLGDLLAAEDGAGHSGPPPMALLTSAMAGDGTTPVEQRFRLLHALHGAVTDAAPRS